MGRRVKQRPSTKGLSRWSVAALVGAGLLAYLLIAGGFAVGVEWLGPIGWQRLFFPFADPKASVLEPAFVIGALVAGGTIVALRHRQGMAGSILAGLVVLGPVAVLAGWSLHAANALADRSPEQLVEYRVAGYRDGRKSLLDEVVLEPISGRQAVSRRCVGPGLLGGWPPPNARVQLRTRAGALGWRWISGFSWNPQQYPSLASPERRRFVLDRYACAA